MLLPQVVVNKASDFPAVQSLGDTAPAEAASASRVGFSQASQASIKSTAGFARASTVSLETSVCLAHAERLGTASSGSWRVKDIDWSFAFRAQHFGSAFFAVFIIVALGLVHYLGKPKHRPFFLYDASIGYISGGDTVPATVAVLVPFASLFISLCCYELWVYKLENWHITNAVATIMHFMLDSVCAFVTVECFTESTKLAAGRLRPDFFQQCQPDSDWTSGLVQLGVLQTIQCTSDNIDGRKSFCSGHASTSSVLVGYNIVYLLWAG